MIHWAADAGEISGSLLDLSEALGGLLGHRLLLRKGVASQKLLPAGVAVYHRRQVWPQSSSIDVVDGRATDCGSGNQGANKLGVRFSRLV
ncbi:hypothetical protein IEQ34_005251 [Dendrobium chrysotoxum]|uniref:Uncharacterized protein n=1 Tax=Dendrobium chrysotoxum TaxID=161865 RepID=A0AAV7HAY9_DENCH|nr:hypothetical protein IEQ34_005251 [Dendrobium chrysotoxum]